MELTNDFRVSVSRADAWKVLNDVERIAPMLPGAQLQEIEGEELRGIVKVKVGPITAQYKGTATFQEQDEAAGRVVLKASGRDTRGQGNASATITATLTPDGDGTKVRVVTDLTITGKVAQFGRGVLADVSSKLIGQFVDSLEADLERNSTGGEGGDAVPDPGASGAGALGADPSGPEAAPAAVPGVPVSDGSGAPASPTANGAAAPSAVRKIDQPEPEPVDLLVAVNGAMLKRIAPVAGLGLLALVVVLRRMRKR
jgi:carbon monoxide dehydrogenase subunit G